MLPICTYSLLIEGDGLIVLITYSLNVSKSDLEIGLMSYFDFPYTRE